MGLSHVIHSAAALKRKVFPALLACDLSSKSFVSHWDLHHNKMEKQIALRL